MRNAVIRSVAAVVIICVGMVIALHTESGTLAARTIRLNRTRIDFRILVTDDHVYASARQKRFLGNGWRTTMVLGRTDEIGTADPVILVDEPNHQVVLKVGTAGATFNPRSNAFEGESGVDG